MSIKGDKLAKGKTFCLRSYMLTILIVVCFISRGYSFSIVKEIVRLEIKNQNLNKKIINSLSLEFSDNKKFDYGQTCKYLLQDKEFDDSWLFKVYKSLFPVNNSIATSRLAQLLGIDISEINRVILPINERLICGSIQKLILQVENIKEVSFNKLSPEQIECIMKNQILDWIVFNTDVDGDEFIVKKENGKIIVIDKDESFLGQKITSLADNVKGDSYYYQFWEAYIKGEIQIDEISFKKIFKIIDYFRRIDDKHITKIINDSLKKIISSAECKLITEEIILRKHNLRRDFRWFYENLAKRKGFILHIPSVDKSNVYALVVLEKLKTNISRKEIRLNQSKFKKPKKQKNIQRMSSMDAWILVKRINYKSAKEFFSLSDEIIGQLESLKEKTPSVYEQFSIYLYIEQIINLQSKTGVEKFVQREINRIILYSEQMTDSKILSIEYNLRAVYKKMWKKFSEYKENIEKEPVNILAHLDYLWYPIWFHWEQSEKSLIFNKYEKLVNKNATNLVYKVLYGIILKDKKYFEKIDDNFIWKHLGLALVYSQKEYNKGRERNMAIKECNEALFCKGERQATYWAHIFLGLLYQYNDRWERFEYGFEAKKSLREYKKAVAIHPESVKGHLNLGIIYLILDKPHKALKEFKEISKLDPQYGKEHFHFNKIKEKKLYKNKKEYLKAVRMNTLSGKQHYILYLAYLIKGDKELARKHLDKSLEFGYKVK